MLNMTPGFYAMARTIRGVQHDTQTVRHWSGAAWSAPVHEADTHDTERRQRAAGTPAEPLPRGHVLVALRRVAID